MFPNRGSLASPSEGSLGRAPGVNPNIVPGARSSQLAPGGAVAPAG